MENTTFNARTALLAGAMLFSTATASFAGAQDYEFQAVNTDIKQGRGSTVSVRLIDKRTGKAVPDAVIFTTRMDMAPDGMEMMTTTVEPSPSTEPGVYAFMTNLSMEGGWRFQVAAKVQGEPETVKGEVVFKAVP
ncbi:YtkA-like protien [Rhizobium subbaraonis]|uniref:YtkA-like protien n=1 Tax=Rhizobium subbaraonis TaxID=908946 RepID=A0A285V2L6_9HYPH|nr:FixH family protein [Rhizobium subbaraonis]SOC48273.1 YtkA-like protien [Rhizobium subbaraonis]